MLRAVAAAGVVFVHVYLLNGVTFLGNRTPTVLVSVQGATGVWLFFVISGYVISRPFVSDLVGGKRSQLRPYGIRRFFRIYPLFLLSLIVLALVSSNWADATAKAKVSNVFLILNLVPGQQNGTILSVWWTLGIEVCFYCFVPLAALLLYKRYPGGISARKLALGVVVLWAVSVTWAVLAATLPQTQTGLWLRQVFPAQLSSFCPGILLAVAEHGDIVSPHWRERIERALRMPFLVFPVFLVLAVMGAYGVTSVGHIPLATFSIQFYAVGYGLIVAWALRVHVPDRRWVRVWAWLGVISYGIYLWHAVILTAFTQHQVGIPLTAAWVKRGMFWLPIPSHAGIVTLLVRFGWILLLTVAVSAITWYVMESRIITWAHGRAKRHAPVARSEG
jgi:peptidoglycan/LPS O-acetylase OafA/YrhL